MLLLLNNKEDTNQVKLLYEISLSYSIIDYNKGLHYGNKALLISKKIKWKFGEAKSYSSIGKNYFNKSDYLQALEYHHKARIILEKLNKPINILKVYNYIASTHFAQKNYDLAIFYYNKSLKIYDTSSLELISQYPIGLIWNNLAINYQAKGQYENAINLFEKTITSSLSDSTQIANALMYEAAPYWYLHKPDSALKKIKKSYELSIRLGHLKEAAESLVYESAIYEENKRFDDAINCFKKYLSMYVRLNEPMGIARANCFIGFLMIKKLKSEFPPVSKRTENQKKQIAQALHYLNEGTKLAFSNSDFNTLAEYEKKLSEAYEFSGDYRKSLEALKKATLYYDSLNSKEKDREFYRKEIEYDFNKKKDSIAFGNQIQKEKIISLQQQNKLKDFRLKQQWLIGIFIFVLIFSMALIISNRYKIKSITLQKKLETEKNERLLQESIYNIDLNNLRLAALRTQMNPHFIFNCLNSIKLYAEENDTASASAFLSSFSKLIRKMLDSTRSEKIILADEIEMIQLYLNMEKMRLKEKLNFIISINDDVDVNFIEIPTLLIQPYLENAIWHGLMPKEKGGIITINIKNEGTDNLVISIIDDGIGRTKSDQLKTDKSHTSLGTKLTNERIRIYNEKYKTHCKISISDIFNNDTEIAGTKVDIIIPYLFRETNTL